MAEKLSNVIGAPFDNYILDKKTLEYIFETAENSYVVYANSPWSSLGVIKKK